MGHISNVLQVEKRSQIIPSAEDYAFVNVDRQENRSGRYHGNMTIHDNLVYDSFEDACAAIERLDNGWYDDHAVKFHPSKPFKESARLKSLKERLDKTKALLRTYESDHDIHKQKAKLVTCKQCESKLARKWLKGQTCPVCGADLRAEYVLDKINGYKEKIKYLREQIDSEESRLRRKCCDKSKTLWAVKVEVHC